MRRRTTIFIAAGVALAIGCERRHEAAPPPATQASATRRANGVTPPATRPAAALSPAIFVIADRPFSFPPCKLVKQDKDGATRVTLFSIDPPEAVRDGYTGNSFYFRFNLDADADAAEDLVGQQVVFRNSVSEKNDDTNGLFIAGGKQTLRPADAAISFDRIDGELVVTVGGTFRVYDDQTPADAAPTVKVRAMLEPAVDGAKP